MTERLRVSAIPHRPPFLFVDRILEVTEDSIVTTMTAHADWDFFRGHYPGNPVMPGVLICECCFQAGALLMAHRLEEGQAARGVPVVTRITDARFKRIVKPGDMLRVEVTLDETLDRAYFLTGRATVEGKAVVRVTFACTQTEQEESGA